jgi:hypothetical protein
MVQSLTQCSQHMREMAVQMDHLQVENNGLSAKVTCFDLPPLIHSLRRPRNCRPQLTPVSLLQVKELEEGSASKFTAINEQLKSLKMVCLFNEAVQFHYI